MLVAVAVLVFSICSLVLEGVGEWDCGDWVGLWEVGIGDLLSEANSDLLGDELAGMEGEGDREIELLIDPVLEGEFELDPVEEGEWVFDPVGEGVWEFDPVGEEEWELVPVDEKLVDAVAVGVVEGRTTHSV